MDFKKATIDSYDKTVDEYVKIISSFEQLPQLEIFANLMPAKGKILDLGCGPGQHSKFFSDLNFNVTGIDLSKNMISRARSKYRNIDFKVMDIYNLKFDNLFFDGIWASASLLHIEKSKVLKVLIDLKKILKDDGYIYISLKVGNGEKLIKDDRYNGVPKFFSFFQPIEIEEFLDISGLQIFEKDIVNERKTYDTNSWLHLFVIKS